VQASILFKVEFASNILQICQDFRSACIAIHNMC
jgi:hypothetical protein